MNWNTTKSVALLRLGGSALLGAALYGAFYVIALQFGPLLADLPAAVPVLLIFVILALPVIAFLHVSGTEPARFLGVAVFGATVAFLIETIWTGGSAALPFIYLFIVAILTGGTLLHMVLARSEVNRHAFQVLGAILFGAVGLLAYLFIAGELFFRFGPQPVTETVATVVLAGVFVVVSALYIHVTETEPSWFFGLALAGCLVAVGIIGAQPMAQPHVVAPFIGAIGVGAAVILVAEGKSIASHT